MTPAVRLVDICLLLIDRVMPLNGERVAEARWRDINAGRRKAGCRCGEPATRVTYDFSVLGSVPSEKWTCDRHVGVAVWVNGQPAWEAR